LLSKNIKIKIYSTIILPVVLYGSETWSLKLWEERRMNVFQNIWEEESGENYIMRSLMISKYHSGDQTERYEMGGTSSTYGERRGVYRILVGTLTETTRKIQE